MMKIAIAQLQETGQREFFFSGTKETLGLEDIPFALHDTEVTVVLADSDHGYYLHGSLVSGATLLCDRCLTEFDYQIEAPLATLVVLDQSTEFEDEDVIEVPASSLSIDLTKFVHDSLLLALPFKLLCKEDCKGLCAQCGTNLNEDTCDCEDTSIDPRWNKLKELNIENQGEV